jgi:hypothetical protein
VRKVVLIGAVAMAFAVLVPSPEAAEPLVVDPAGDTTIDLVVQVPSDEPGLDLLAGDLGLVDDGATLQLWSTYRAAGADTPDSLDWSFVLSGKRFGMGPSSDGTVFFWVDGDVRGHVCDDCSVTLAGDTVTLSVPTDAFESFAAGSLSSPVELVPGTELLDVQARAIRWTRALGAIGTTADRATADRPAVL